VRLEKANQRLLVVIGATAEGKKELLALTDGFRESEESWKDVLLDLQRRGLTVDPRLAIGDGAPASGRPSLRCLATPARSAAGCTRREMC
jgi:hypothetical protein